MTEKELHKLRRQDLLELLLSQSKEVTDLQRKVRDLEHTVETVTLNNDHLKEKLDDKDAQIEKLKGRLDDKDATIAQLRAGGLIHEENSDTPIARLEEIFRVAQKAAEVYMKKKGQKIREAGELAD